MSRFFISLLVLPFLTSPSFGEENNSDIYYFNYWIDVPVTAFGIGFNFYGQQKLRTATRLRPEQYANYRPEDINAFDRAATKQNPAFANKAHDLSDITLRTTPLLPFFLALDKEIRSDGPNLLLMYLETQSVSTLIYLASAMNVKRNRPFMYNPDEFEQRKSGPKSRDSFFSGHVSAVTTASFFMSKVYLDYHPELKSRQWIFYTMASLPSLYTAYFRFRAGKHFPSDLIVGYLVGASTGILIPQLHKSNFYQRISYSPVIGPDGMLAYFSYSF